MKESRRVTMTKTLLKESLLELLKEKPLPKITIKEICENADVNRSTFYLHYVDQFALCDEIENDSVEKINTCLAKVSIKGNRVEGLTEFLHYMKSNGELFKILMRPDFNNSFRVRFSEVAVKRLAQLDYHDNVSEEDKDYIFRFMFMGVLGMLEQWVKCGFDKSPEEIAAFILALLPSISASLRKREIFLA
ncbi:MAG: TetR family transcriptional regulator C-terminal domain-containing protein [Clostridia bacterium]|nr:TetR family transcriptional regulator C-terminal domain-containing protein [Clostridia bacterium]